MPKVSAGHDDADPLLLYLTDLHFSKESSRYRIGDFVGDLLLKLQEVGKLIKRHKVPLVVIGGDLTEGPMVSLEMGDRVLDELESWGVPIYVTVGNHDVFGNQLKTLDSSWLGHVFRRSNVIHQLDKIYVGDVCIWGVHFNTGIEEELADREHSTSSSELFYQDDELFDPEGKSTGEYDHKKIAKKLIEVVHAMVVPGGMHPNARQIDPDDYKTQAQLILSGDYHPGWEDVYERMDLRRFVNPGAFARRTVSDSDCMRQVRVVLVRYNLDVEFLPITCMKPVEEVFDLKASKVAKEKEKELNSFMQELTTVTTDKVDVRERVVEIAQEQKAPAKIRDNALERLDRFIAEGAR